MLRAMHQQELEMIQDVGILGGRRHDAEETWYSLKRVNENSLRRSQERLSRLVTIRK